MRQPRETFGTFAGHDGTEGPESDDATVLLPSASAIQGASDEQFAFGVPLGGDVVFVWGGSAIVSAKSRDSTVASVDVTSAAIRVTGLATGETHVAVKTDDGEWWPPVEVK